jgi:two-component system sensor histidine kinase TctE
MLTPLLLLWPVSLVLTWLVAQGIAGKPFDRALEYNARAHGAAHHHQARQAEFVLAASGTRVVACR